MGLNKIERKKRIKKRVRSVIFGTLDRPRLSVYRSNTEIYAQIIDDTTGKTIVSVSSREKGFVANGSRLEVAMEVGRNLGKKAMDLGLAKVCFDRGTVLYHGRVKSLANGARESGLEF